MASIGCSSLSGTVVRPQRQAPKVARTGAVRCAAISEQQKKVFSVGAALFAAASLSISAPAYAKKPLSEVKSPAQEAGTADNSGAKAETSNPKPTGLIAELKEKSTTNKELNNKKRLATSYANFAQSRTVQDGTCTFPNNLFGCDEPRIAGRVRFITEDRELECQGKPDGKCASKFQAAKVPSAFTKSPSQQ